MDAELHVATPLSFGHPDGRGSSALEVKAYDARRRCRVEPSVRIAQRG
jgi:hypothetical protein